MKIFNQEWFQKGIRIKNKDYIIFDYMRNIEADSNMEYSVNSTEEETKNQIPDEQIDNKSEIGEDSQELIYDLLNQKAENRNFKIYYKVENGQIIISLKNENGEIMDFKEYIPSGYTMVSAEKFGCNIVSKEILFDPREVDKKGFLLSLAHELGHARRDKILEHYNVNFFKQLGALLINQVRKAIQLRSEMKQLSHQEKNDKLQKELFSRPNESFIPLKYLENTSEKNAKSERNAWAESLKILRRFDKEGFNVFDEFESCEEIKAFIAYCLFTHEMSAKNKQKISIGNESQEQYKRKFVRLKDLDVLKKYISRM